MLWSNLFHTNADYIYAATWPQIPALGYMAIFSGTFMDAPSNHGYFFDRSFSNALILSSLSRVRPILSRPFKRQCFLNASSSNENSSPLGRITYRIKDATKIYTSHDAAQHSSQLNHGTHLAIHEIHRNLCSRHRGILKKLLHLISRKSDRQHSIVDAVVIKDVRK